MKRRTFFKRTVGALVAAPFVKPEQVTGILRRASVTVPWNHAPSAVELASAKHLYSWVCSGFVVDKEGGYVKPYVDEDTVLTVAEFNDSAAGADADHSAQHLNTELEARLARKLFS